jgi:adenosylmethionine-8-amino-7-oxononanoate aminotransferase
MKKDPVTLDHHTLLEQDRKQIHPLQHPKLHQDPLIVERGEGIWLYTTDGRKILDGMAGMWNVNVGYGNPELIEAASAQMSKLAYTSNFAGMTNLPSIELAQKLAGFAYPNLHATFFASGGSEANDSAFKTARYYWKRMGKPGKTKIIARTRAYHGISFAATFATGIERYHTMFGPAVPGFLHVAAPYPYRFEAPLRPDEGVGQAAARLLEEAIRREGADTIAAFIAEPVQGVGGVIVPPDDYFSRIRRICDAYDILFIADEVITGFGRTGAWFGLHHWNVQPDILVFAKGITSGYMPLGGIQIADKIHEAILTASDSEVWMHGYTYSGHATACAVGLANIAVLEREGVVEHGQAMGERLLKGLQSLAEFPFVGEVRGKGLMCAVEIVTDKETRQPDPAKAGLINNAALKRSLRSRPLANNLAFAPPLTITAEEVDEIVRLLGSAMDSV